MTIRISPYSVRMPENRDQNNFEYGHFSRSVCFSDKEFDKFLVLFSNIQNADSQSKSYTKITNTKLFAKLVVNFCYYFTGYT